MSGIAGVLDLKNRSVEKDIVRKMIKIQKHRGPDGEGFYFGENIGLGHTRLAIIDLSENANQPITNEDNTKWIIHTGEIYNYSELREKLIKSGHKFKSAGDAEVILHAFEEWGKDALNRFNGMWAFAVWDAKKRELFAARDRFGVKPLYYFFDGKYFIFASEIKALLSHPSVKRIPNEQAIYNYLSTGYGYADISGDTFFKGIERLREGHYMVLKDGNPEIKCYWDMTPGNDSGIRDMGELVEEFRAIFDDAIKLRLRSDAELGIALSGGLDSSAITCTAGRMTGRKLKTFSSCFDEKKYDEREFIRPVLDATGFEHNFIFSGRQDVFELLNRGIWHQDEPTISLGSYAQWNVFEAAKKCGIKAVLTGQGGDETLAGYHKYFPYFFADLSKNAKISKLIGELQSYAEVHKYSKLNAIGAAFHILASSLIPRRIKDKTVFFHENRVQYLNENFKRKHKRNVYAVTKFKGILNNELYNAFKISPLPHLLRSDDRGGMAHSVESRSPFLDYRLVEFLFSVPSVYKIKDGYTKHLLRESMKGILPEANRLRKDKKGFPVPAALWFRGRMKEKIGEIFGSESFSKRGYVNPVRVREMFNDHLSGRADYTTNIWSLLNLELWMRIFIDGGMKEYEFAG